jgi:phosphoglycerate dehydrogenase-like enzyme
VIDFPALEEALQSGRLAFAGLDVCDREPLAQESPLWEMPNVLLTSHSAGWSPQLAGRLCDLFAENLQDIRHDRPLKNIISLR